MSEAELRRRIEDLLLLDTAVRDATAANDELQWRLDTWLAPTVERRLAEVDVLRHRLCDMEAHANERLVAAEQLAQAMMELATARREVEAIRGSRSWRLTAPLRWVHGCWRRVRAAL